MLETAPPGAGTVEVVKFQVLRHWSWGTPVKC